jgi:hypothetical protein
MPRLPIAYPDAHFDTGSIVTMGLLASAAVAALGPEADLAQDAAFQGATACHLSFVH